MVPWGLEKILVWVKDRYGNPPIIITENGVAMPGEDKMSTADAVKDEFRVNYLSGY